MAIENGHHVYAGAIVGYSIFNTSLDAASIREISILYPANIGTAFIFFILTNNINI